MSPARSGSQRRGNEVEEPATQERKISAYDAGFKQHLEDHGICLALQMEQYPSNWEEINTRLSQRRPSLSPSQFSDTAFKTFTQINDNAASEASITSQAYPTVTGKTDIPSQQNIPFNNLEYITDKSITKAQPDFYDGACPSELDPRVRKQLSGYIEPSTNKSRPVLPNFFAEVKGPDGSARVAGLQALYDGALGARGMHELRSYVDPKTAYDNNAYAIASAYHPYGGILSMYAVHPVKSTNPNRQTDYCMTKLNAYLMTSNANTFRQGATALRNSRDWSKEARTKAIDAANKKALNAGTPGFESLTQGFVSLSSNEQTRAESEISADELSSDVGIHQSTNQPTPR